MVTLHTLGRRRATLAGLDAFDRFRIGIEGRLLAEAAHVVAESPEGEQDLRELYDADLRKVSVIPFGFDAAEMRPMNRRLARAERHLDPDERILLQVARPAPYDGVDTAIRRLTRPRLGGVRRRWYHHGEPIRRCGLPARPQEGFDESAS